MLTCSKCCQVRDILQLTSHAMLRAVRVVLANGSLAEARDQKMLMKGGPLCGAGGVNQGERFQGARLERGVTRVTRCDVI